MEKIKSICMMRDLIQAMARLEAQLQSRYALSCNEAMALCCISGDAPTAGCVAENTGLLPSHTSKVLKSLEVKGLIARAISPTDRRQMCFTLTPEGQARIQSLKSEGIEIPPYLSPLYQD